MKPALLLESFKQIAFDTGQGSWHFVKTSVLAGHSLGLVRVEIAKINFAEFKDIDGQRYVHHFGNVWCSLLKDKKSIRIDAYIGTDEFPTEEDIVRQYSEHSRECDDLVQEFHNELVIPTVRKLNAVQLDTVEIELTRASFSKWTSSSTIVVRDKWEVDV